MAIFHWFRKKSRSTDAEGAVSAAEKSSPEPTILTQTTSENSGKEAVPEAPSIEQQSASLPVTPLSVSPTPKQPEPSAEPTAQPAKTASTTDSDQAGPLEGHQPPTVRATTASGKIRFPDLTADSAKTEIRLRLGPILSNFPLNLEQPSIPALSETEAEMVLPLEVIQSQLANGRVVVSAGMFCRALPNDLRPFFDHIEPTAEIPIPLREIFLHLPPEAIKLREDQEIDCPRATIQTPFSTQAEEDAKRLGQGGALGGAPAPPGPEPILDKEETPASNEAATTAPVYSSDALPADVGEQQVPSPPSRFLSEIPVNVDSDKLRSIFMTDEALDLPKTISMVGELPGLRACLLNTVDGLKLTGNLDDQNQEQAISALMPALFQQAQSKLASARLGTLETITLSCGQGQLSTFIQGNFCLTVLHDNRPFKPGVREKVQAVISELVTLTRKNHPL
jgi:predicted regulator of Ras-like GTPase activity (Roadblock/LC7/MglB family)